ncbi:hypothetical protein GCM10009067_40260 [Haloarcula sebkhae]|uniref:Uncharacterized protein n=1 Tax=Haloarcula sebkhae TaxID=932660 RepID=A0A830EX60_9EURY|nr:hypothetical protein GCM10009067_40260 [Haloarcula sebkhae]
MCWVQDLSSGTATLGGAWHAAFPRLPHTVLLDLERLSVPASTAERVFHSYPGVTTVICRARVGTG